MRRRYKNKRIKQKENCPPLPRGIFHTQQLDECFELNQRLLENADGTRHVKQAHAPETNTNTLERLSYQ